MPRPLTAHRSDALAGDVHVPGDKSISHRALILGALAVGETRISGLLEGADVLATKDAVAALGAETHRDADGVWRINGRGIGGLREPDAVLDMGNSGTGVRLLMGVAAGHAFTSFFAGDASLSRRPMDRVMAPLRRMGAAFTARSGGRLPLAVRGSDGLIPVDYDSPVASAQVKSAVLLAGLHAPGRTSVTEPRPSRDHTELILQHFGAAVSVQDHPDGARTAVVDGQPELQGRDVVVPGDVSSAAFPLVAALLVPGSTVTLRGIGVNPLRTGLLATLAEMGAAIGYENHRSEAGEPVADLVAGAGPLRGVEVPADRVPAMIDEYPILAVAAALAEGPTRMHGLAELRVKECDRLAAMARGLQACGVDVEEGEDWLTVHGTGGKPPKGGATIAAELDHRIAMAFLVLGLACQRPVSIDDAGPIDTSFPGFEALMTGLGAGIAEEKAS